MRRRLEDFLTHLAGTGSADETWAATQAFLLSLGFNLVFYGYAAPLTPETPELAVSFRNNYPDWYDRRYAEMGYAAQDPSILHCVTQLAPTHIGVEGLRRDGLELQGMERQLVHESAEFGLRTGIVFPMRSSGRYRLAGMSVSNAMGVEEFDRFIKDRKLTVHLAAMCAHTRIQLQLAAETSAAAPLTPREREVLLWSAMGLDGEAIGEQLGLSLATVNFHIANAMRKLGAATRAHAVARAIALEAIGL